MDARDTKRVSITLTMEVTMTVDVADGPNGPEVVSVRDVDLPEAADVMQALDHQRQFEHLDRLYAAA